MIAIRILSFRLFRGLCRVLCLKHVVDHVLCLKHVLDSLLTEKMLAIG